MKTLSLIVKQAFEKGKHTKNRRLSAAALLLVALLVIPCAAAPLWRTAGTDPASIRWIAAAQVVMDRLKRGRTFDNQAVQLFVGRRQYGGETRLDADGRVLVDVVEFGGFVGASDHIWEGDSLRITGKGYDVSVPGGAMYTISAGRCFFAETPGMRDKDALFLPVDCTAKAFGYRVLDRGEDGAVRLAGDGTVVPGDEFYAEDEVYWLSRIISAESRGEPLLGKIAVGNVVLNRRAMASYPDTIYGVIFDRSCGVQFSPTEDGSVWNEPTEESVAAAKICLEGYSVSHTIAFFLNPAIAESSWVSRNRPYEMTIGNHDFYS